MIHAALDWDYAKITHIRYIHSEVQKARKRSIFFKAWINETSALSNSLSAIAVHKEMESRTCGQKSLQRDDISLGGKGVKTPFSLILIEKR